MDVKELRYFISVARNGNITKAAEELYITQPTLSRSLSNLESELGVQLLERSNRNTLLTEKGKEFYKYSLEIVELIDKREKEIKETDTISGEIVIGSAVASSFEILADIIKKFNILHPLVKFDLITGNKNLILEKMDLGLIDVGLIIGCVENDNYKNIKLESIDKFVLLIRKDSPLSNKKYIVPRDLDNIYLTIPKSSNNRILFDWYGDNLDKLHVNVTHDILNNAKMLVQNNMCSAITIEKAAKQILDNSLMYLPLKPDLKVESFIIWNKQKKHSLTTEKFIEFVNEYIQ